VLSVFWAENGSRLYWVASDGQAEARIVGQLFDPERGPKGASAEVYQMDWSPAWASSEITRVAAARGRIIVPVIRVQSDLWMAKLGKGR